MKLLKRIALMISALILLVLVIGGINDSKNKTVSLTEYTFTHQEVPKAFAGYKIMLISDLHEAPFAEQIIGHIHRQEPDIIVFTGDMVQLPDNTIKETVKIAKEIHDIPMYAVSGNHERLCGSYDNIIKELWGAGITPLDNDSVCIEKGRDSILLLGVKDPKDDVVSNEKVEKMCRQIKSEFPDGPCFSVLLMHRADLYPAVKDTGVDLILSGHLHGGIIRLPFIGGIIGHEEQGFFPKYTYGFVQEGDSAGMIVSGGCDKNPDKRRFFNPPEVVMVTLEGED